MRAALAVAVLAVLIRLLPGSDAARPLFSDERDYDHLARTLASTGRYEDEGHPTAYRPVGYPAFVAAIYRLAGPEPGGVRIAQSMFDGATTFLMFLLLRGRGARTALGASILWATFPPAILYTRFLRPETLSVFLLVASAVGLSKESSRSGAGRLLLGALLGVTVLVKSELVLILPAIPFVIERGHALARRTLVLLAGAVLVIGPWVARNAVEVGAATLATSFGPVFLIGNHPGATGGYAPDVPDSMLPSSEGEAAASAEASRTAAEYIARRPDLFIARVARKWALILMAETELVVTAFHPNPGDPSSSFRAKAQTVPVWLHVAVSAPYAALVLIGTLGFLGAPGGTMGRFFLAIVAAWLFAHGLTFGGSRYHFPWMPFLAAYAAMFLVDIPKSVRAMPTWAWFVAALTWLVVIAVLAVEAHFVWGA